MDRFSRRLVVVILIGLAAVELAAQTRLAEIWQFSNGTKILSGSATPEGASTAPPGSTYHRTNGTVYYKLSGTGNTGWSSALVGGGTPAVSNTSSNSCGTTAASLAGSNNAGTITVGATAGTSCTVTFTTAAPSAWVCVANDQTTTGVVKATSSSTTVSVFAGTFTAADKLDYICFAR